MSPVAAPQPLRRKCPYCRADLVIRAPYESDVEQVATIPCPMTVCNRPLRVNFIRGKAVGLFPPRVFRFGSRLRGRGGGQFRPVADLVDEACEAGYLKSFRAAAVALRSAAEAFVALEFHRARSAMEIPTLGRAINQLDAYPGFTRLTDHKRSATRRHLSSIWDLGDSGAHLQLADPTRQVTLEPTAIEDGVAAFEAILIDVYGWN